MKEYQIPNLKTAAYVGSAWLLALTSMLWFSAPEAESANLLIFRALIGLLCLAGAALLAKVGAGYGTKVYDRSVVKDAARSLRGAHRVA